MLAPYGGHVGESTVNRDDVQRMKLRAQALMEKVDQIRVAEVKLRRDLLAVKATAISPDGLVTVTVGPRGQVLRIDLDPRIYRRPDSQWLADTITATIEAAAADAQEQVLTLTRPFVPDELMRAQLELDDERMLALRDPDLLGGDRR